MEKFYSELYNKGISFLINLSLQTKFKPNK